MDRIGVRELRQHASTYLKRVAGGEVIEVTDRGTPVARLVPIAGDAWADLLASGRIRPPAVEGDLLDEAPRDFGFGASQQLAAARDPER